MQHWLIHLCTALLVDVWPAVPCRTFYRHCSYHRSLVKPKFFVRRDDVGLGYKMMVCILAVDNACKAIFMKMA